MVMVKGLAQRVREVNDLISAIGLSTRPQQEFERWSAPMTTGNAPVKK